MNTSTEQKTALEADFSARKSFVPAQRSLAELLAPLERIAERSPSLVANHGAQFTSGGRGYELPRNGNETIDGFRARNGIIRDSFPGVLSAPPKARPRPFETILETPQQAPNYLKEAALVAALRMILIRYREMMAYAPNL
jgi:hypothetical protein